PAGAVPPRWPPSCQRQLYPYAAPPSVGACPPPPLSPLQPPAAPPPPLRSKSTAPAPTIPRAAGSAHLRLLCKGAPSFLQPGARRGRRRALPVPGGRRRRAGVRAPLLRPLSPRPAVPRLCPHRRPFPSITCPRSPSPYAGPSLLRAAALEGSGAVGLAVTGS